jgi:hypothetical protein
LKQKAGEAAADMSRFPQSLHMRRRIHAYEEEDTCI